MGLKKRTHVSPEFNLASMIDVIFLLLMFFMLTSKLVETNALNVDLAESSVKENQTDNKNISITVQENGSFNFESDDTPLDLLSLEQKMIEKAADLEKKGADRKNIAVIVNAHRNSTTQNLVDVMSIIRKNGLQMTIATQDQLSGK